METNCRDNEFTEFIDHIVLDQRAAERLDSSSFRHVTYRPEDEDVWDLISDHCPVVVELWIKSRRERNWKKRRCGTGGDTMQFKTYAAIST